MSQLHSVIFILHIIFGSLALILFWVPIFTKKGQLNHVRFGHHYKLSMYAVAGTGALMSVMVIAAPLVIKHEYATSEHAAEIAQSLRIFWAFLLYLALLTFTSTRHGIRVLQTKKHTQSLKTLNYLAPIVLLIVGGIPLFAVGYIFDTVLHMVFGILGTVVGISMLRYCLQDSLPNKQWVLEHISSMIGSGIGAYTAFIAFGGRVVLDEFGSYQIIFWIAPGVIGSLASYLLCKRYKKLYRIDTRAELARA